MKLIERNDPVLVSLAGQVANIRALMDRYANAPVDFANACVVRLAELHPDLAVCTTDGHFRFFRKHGQEAISRLAPFAS